MKNAKKKQGARYLPIQWRVGKKHYKRTEWTSRHFTSVKTLFNFFFRLICLFLLRIRDPMYASGIIRRARCAYIVVAIVAIWFTRRIRLCWTRFRPPGLTFSYMQTIHPFFLSVNIHPSITSGCLITFTVRFFRKLKLDTPRTLNTKLMLRTFFQLWHWILWCFCVEIERESESICCPDIFFSINFLFRIRQNNLLNEQNLRWENFIFLWVIIRGFRSLINWSIVQVTMQWRID